MIVLGIDTALSACSAAVVEDGRVLASISEPMTRGHQERLAPMVAEVMAEAGVGFGQLGRVGVTVGPGAFTGLRVGLAFAKGLGLALDIPVVGITTLQGLAEGRPGHVAAAIDAKRGEVYLQVFRDGEALSAPAAMPAADAVAQLRGLGAATVVGSGGGGLADLEGVRLDPRDTPDPAAVARLAAAAADPAPPRPLYLRAPDARLPELRP